LTLLRTACAQIGSLASRQARGTLVNHDFIRPPPHAGQRGSRAQTVRCPDVLRARSIVARYV